LDLEWLDGLGFSPLDDDARASLLAAVIEEFSQRVGERIESDLAPEDLEEFHRRVDEDDHEAATALLKERYPSYEAMIYEQRHVLERELRGGARVVCDVLVPGLAERRTNTELRLLSAVDDDRRPAALDLLVDVFGIGDREHLAAILSKAPAVIVGVPESAAHAVLHPLRADLDIEAMVGPASASGGVVEPEGEGQERT